MSDYEFLNPLLAFGGNSSEARSARARAQWRDRYGRWIEMGRGANFSLRLKDGSTVSINGRFVGVAADNRFGQVYVQGDQSGIPDGFYEVTSSNAEKIQATIDTDYLKKAGVDSDTVIERPRAASEIQDERTIVRLDAPAGWKKNPHVSNSFITPDNKYEIIEEGSAKAGKTYALVQDGREIGSYKTLPEAFVSAANIDGGKKVSKSTAPSIAKANQHNAPDAPKDPKDAYAVREASSEGFLVPTGTDSETVSAEDWSADSKAALANYVTAHKDALSQPGRRLVADLNDDGSVTFDTADHVGTQEEADALSANRSSTPEGAGNDTPRDSDAQQPVRNDAGADQPVGGGDSANTDVPAPAPADNGADSARLDAIDAKVDAISAKIDTALAKSDAPEAPEEPAEAPEAPAAAAEAPKDSGSLLTNARQRKGLQNTDPTYGYGGPAADRQARDRANRWLSSPAIGEKFSPAQREAVGKHFDKLAELSDDDAERPGSTRFEEGRDWDRQKAQAYREAAQMVRDGAVPKTRAPRKPKETAPEQAPEPEFELEAPTADAPEADADADAPKAAPLERAPGQDISDQMTKNEAERQALLKEASDYQDEIATRDRDPEAGAEGTADLKARVAEIEDKLVPALEKKYATLSKKLDQANGVQTLDMRANRAGKSAAKFPEKPEYILDPPKEPAPFPTAPKKEDYIIDPGPEGPKEEPYAPGLFRDDAESAQAPEAPEASTALTDDRINEWRGLTKSEGAPEGVAGHAWAVQKMLGTDGPPDVLSGEDFDNAEGEELFRGVSSPDQKDAFIDGDDFIGMGGNGSGIYLSTEKQHAARYGNFEDARIIDAKLKPDANIVDGTDLEARRQADFERHYAEGNKLAAQLASGDLNTYASSIGVDGYRIELEGVPSVVIANKSALIVRGRDTAAAEPVADVPEAAKPVQGTKNGDRVHVGGEDGPLGTVTDGSDSPKGYSTVELDAPDATHRNGNFKNDTLYAAQESSADTDTPAEPEPTPEPTPEVKPQEPATPEERIVLDELQKAFQFGERASWIKKYEKIADSGGDPFVAAYNDYINRARKRKGRAEFSPAEEDLFKTAMNDGWTNEASGLGINSKKPLDDVDWEDLAGGTPGKTYLQEVRDRRPAPAAPAKRTPEEIAKADAEDPLLARQADYKALSNKILDLKDSDSNLDHAEEKVLTKLRAAYMGGDPTFGIDSLSDDDKAKLSSDSKKILGIPEDAPEAAPEDTTPSGPLNDFEPDLDADTATSARAALDAIDAEEAEAQRRIDNPGDYLGWNDYDTENEVLEAATQWKESLDFNRRIQQRKLDRATGATGIDFGDDAPETLRNKTQLPNPATGQTRDSFNPPADRPAQDTGTPAVFDDDIQPAVQPTEWEATGIPAAAAYDAMEHDPSNPEVQASYAALEAAVIDQYRQMKADGLTVDFSDGDPYGSSADMMADVTDNKHLSVFADHGATLPADHPMNKTVDVDGEQVHLNDLFRGVHDYFGHVKSADRDATVGFGPKGEWEAWRTHRLTLPEDSWMALWDETRGQNTWTNYNGDNSALPIADRPFAEQKAGVIGKDQYAADLLGTEPKAPINWEDPVVPPATKPMVPAPSAPKSPDEAEVNDLIGEYQDRIDRANRGEDSDGVSVEEAQQVINSLRERIGAHDTALATTNAELDTDRADAIAIGKEMTDAIGAGDFSNLPDIQKRLNETLDRINKGEADKKSAQEDRDAAQKELDAAEAAAPAADEIDDMDATAQEIFDQWAADETARLKKDLDAAERRQAAPEDLTEAELEDQIDTLEEQDKLDRMVSDTPLPEDIERLDNLRAERDRRNEPGAAVTPEQTGEPSKGAEVIENPNTGESDPDGPDLDAVPETAGDAPEVQPTAEQIENAPEAPSAGPSDDELEEILTYKDSDEDYADMKFMPTKQQRHIVRAVLSEHDVAVEALAGTGKTSTLELIARRLKEVAPDKKILYIAFNKSVQAEADKRMPDNVIATTGDGMSWNSLDASLVKKASSRSNKDLLGIPSEIAKHFGITRTKDASAVDNVRDLQKVIKKFNTSDRDSISDQDFTDAEVDITPEKRAWVNAMWSDIASPKGQMKISNDHVTKLWALSNPDFTKGVKGSKGRGITPDIIFFDEAQDVNPVMAKIVRDQNEKVQKVYVGDTNQAIYAFRGAVDELQKVDVDVRLPLTESWRFGKQVAGMGNRFLAFSKAKHRVVGGGSDGEILPAGSMTDADAVLTRSNGGAMKAILEELENGRNVGVTENFKKSLTSAIDSIEILKRGRTRRDALHEDFQGYQTWKEVEDDINAEKAPARVTMYNNLVNQYGTDGLKNALTKVIVSGTDTPGDSDGSATSGADLKPDEIRPGLRYTLKGTDGNQTVSLTGNTFKYKDEIRASGLFRWVPATKSWDARQSGDAAQNQGVVDALRDPNAGNNGRAAVDQKIDVVVVTAHQSKGLEWDKVKIGDDFRGPRTVKDANGDEVTEMPDPEEIRLAYVAVTRAAKQLDPGALDWIRGYTDDSDEDPNNNGTSKALDAPVAAPEAATDGILEPEAAAGELPELVAPEGVDLPDLDAPFEPEDITPPADAPDTWTNDPIELADTHSKEELEQALTDAVKDPERAHVTTEGIDTPVDTRVVYEAVNEAGGDPRRVVAKALDDIAGDDKNQKNLDEAYTEDPELAPEGFVPVPKEKAVTSSTPGRAPVTSTTHENDDLPTPAALDRDPYEPQGTGIDGTSDDPDVIAENFPVAELEETFKEAITTGAPDVRLTFGEDENAPEANVPVEAIRDAIQKRGKDTNDIIKQVTDENSSNKDIFDTINPIFADPITPEEDAAFDGDPMGRMPQEKIAALQRVIARKQVPERMRKTLDDLTGNWLSNVHGTRLSDLVKTFPNKPDSDVETPIRPDLQPKAKSLAEITDPGLIMDEIEKTYNAKRQANGDLLLSTRAQTDANGNRRTYDLLATRTGNEFFYVYERETNHVTGEVRSRRVSRMTHSARALGNQVDLASSRLALAPDLRSRFQNSKVGAGVQVDKLDADSGEFVHVPEEPIYRPQLNAIRKLSGLGAVSDDDIRDLRDTIARDGADQAMVDAVQGSNALTPSQAKDLVDAINEQTVLADSNRDYQTWSSADGRTPLLEGDRIQYENEEDGTIRFGVVNRRISKRDSKGYAYSDNANIKWDDGGVNSDIISRRLTILQTAEGTDGSERRGPGFVIPPVEETRRAELARERFKPTASKSATADLTDGEYFVDGQKVSVSYSDTLRESDFTDKKFRDLELGDRFVTADGSVREIVGYNRAQRYITITTATATGKPGEFEMHTYKVTPAQKIRAADSNRFSKSILGKQKRDSLAKLQNLERDGRTNGWWPEEGFNTIPTLKGIDNWSLDSLNNMVTDLHAARDTYVPPAPEPEAAPAPKNTFPAPGTRVAPGNLQGIDLKSLASKFQVRPPMWSGMHYTVDTQEDGKWGDALHGAINNQIGFDGKPTLVTPEEFEASVWHDTSNKFDDNIYDPAGSDTPDSKPAVLWRGLRAYRNKDTGELVPPRDQHDVLRKADKPANGYGVFGNGTYFSMNKQVSQGYGEIQRFHLQKGAVGVTDRELYTFQADFTRDLDAGEFDYLSYHERAVFRTIVNDIGRLGSMLGYDFINASGSYIHGIVLLNRSKLVGMENHENNLF